MAVAWQLKPGGLDLEEEEEEEEEERATTAPPRDARRRNTAPTMLQWTPEQF